MELFHKQVGIKARRSKEGLKLETFKFGLVLIVEAIGAERFINSASFFLFC